MGPDTWSLYPAYTNAQSVNPLVPEIVLPYSECPPWALSEGGLCYDQYYTGLLDDFGNPMPQYDEFGNQQEVQWIARNQTCNPKACEIILPQGRHYDKPASLQVGSVALCALEHFEWLENGWQCNACRVSVLLTRVHQQVGEYLPEFGGLNPVLQLSPPDMFPLHSCDSSTSGCVRPVCAVKNTASCYNHYKVSSSASCSYAVMPHAAKRA